MLKILASILIVFLSFSQDASSIFYEVDKSEDMKDKVKYPDWVVSAGAGYIVHETRKYSDNLLDVKTSYDNNLNLDLAVSRYFFQGTYLTFSLTGSNTTERYKADGFINAGTSNPNDTIITSRKSFSFFSPSLSISYYFMNNLEFYSPWYVSVGFGSNIYNGNDGYSRFSVNFQLGKVFPETILGGHFYVNLTTFVYEDRGVREVYYDTNIYNVAYIRRFDDYVTYVSAKLTVGLAFDFFN